MKMTPLYVKSQGCSRQKLLWISLLSFIAVFRLIQPPHEVEQKHQEATSAQTTRPILSLDRDEAFFSTLTAFNEEKWSKKELGIIGKLVSSAKLAALKLLPIFPSTLSQIKRHESGLRKDVLINDYDGSGKNIWQAALMPPVRSSKIRQTGEISDFVLSWNNNEPNKNSEKMSHYLFEKVQGKEYQKKLLLRPVERHLQRGTALIVICKKNQNVPKLATFFFFSSKDLYLFAEKRRVIERSLLKISFEYSELSPKIQENTSPVLPQADITSYIQSQNDNIEANVQSSKIAFDEDILALFEYAGASVKSLISIFPCEADTSVISQLYLYSWLFGNQIDGRLITSGTIMFFKATDPKTSCIQDWSLNRENYNAQFMNSSDENLPSEKF